MNRRNKFDKIKTVARRRKGRYYRINQYIKTPQVRVVNKEGKQLGIIPVFQALKEAEKEGLDLVEVAPKAKPPVCKILNFRDFLYQKKGRRRKSKRKQQQETKEIRLRPFVSEHDLDVRLERIKEFLEAKNKVSISVLFRGREMAHKEFGTKLLEKIITHFGDKINVVAPPKFKGRILTTTIGPKK